MRRDVRNQRIEWCKELIETCEDVCKSGERLGDDGIVKAILPVLHQAKERLAKLESVKTRSRKLKE